MSKQRVICFHIQLNDQRNRTEGSARSCRNGVSNMRKSFIFLNTVSCLDCIATTVFLIAREFLPFTKPFRSMYVQTSPSPQYPLSVKIRSRAICNLCFNVKLNICLSGFAPQGKGPLIWTIEDLRRATATSYRTPAALNFFVHHRRSKGVGSCIGQSVQSREVK